MKTSPDWFRFFFRKRASPLAVVMAAIADVKVVYEGYSRQRVNAGLSGKANGNLHPSMAGTKTGTADKEFTMTIRNIRGGTKVV